MDEPKLLEAVGHMHVGATAAVSTLFSPAFHSLHPRSSLQNTLFFSDSSPLLCDVLCGQDQRVGAGVQLQLLQHSLNPGPHPLHPKSPFQTFFTFLTPHQFCVMFSVDSTSA